MARSPVLGLASFVFALGFGCAGGTVGGGAVAGTSGMTGVAGVTGTAGTTGSAGTGAGAAGTTGGAGTTGTSGTTGAAGVPGACEPGTSTTAWATSCPTAAAAACVPGTWTRWGSSSPENYPFQYETEHFAFYWPAGRKMPDGSDLTMAHAQIAGSYLENVVWPTYMGSPIFFPEPDCTTPNKRKVSIHIIADGLYGGCNVGRPGMWIGPGALADHWGLGHELTHALQCMTPGVPDCGAGGCWLHESHANFMPHQLPEYRGDVHCSEMLVNAPHLYYGSTRDRYCNWQFFEFVKDKHCYKAVNDVWAAAGVPAGQRDPFGKLASTMGWSIEQLNDQFGEWAMHNVTWDYQNPPPTAGGNQGATYRQRYAAPTDKSRPERRLRLTSLEPLDAQGLANRRFVSPSFWAPQRWGYNVVRLFPDAGATSVTVTFRGVTQAGASSGWRWGLVATDAALTTQRYSPLQRGADGQLSFCVAPGESLWLIVVGAPTAMQKIVWDQPYPSIHRFPYMVELSRAWPDGFRDGQPAACPAGLQRHANGGGCAPAGLPATVYVGPYAQVLGGAVTGTARIEDHATILAGATVSGGTVGALSILNRFSVSDTAQVQTTFYPPGFFEPNQALSGTARLFGDVEYRGAGLNRISGTFTGIVDAMSAGAPITDVTAAAPYAWRP